MIRRSAFAALALVLSATCAPAQVTVRDADGNVLNRPPADNRPIHPISNLAEFWRDATASASFDDLRDRVGSRYGRLPWVFTGTVRVGTEADGTPLYQPSTVLVRGIRRSVEDAILGTPAVLVDYEVTEPTFAHVARTRRIEFGGR